MKHILKCPKCSIYTMMEHCPNCGSEFKAVNPRPAKFSPEDQYANYRRKAKMEQWKEKGLA